MEKVAIDHQSLQNLSECKLLPTASFLPIPMHLLFIWKPAFAHFRIRNSPRADAYCAAHRTATTKSIILCSLRLCVRVLIRKLQLWRPESELFLVKAGQGTSGGLDSLCTSIKRTVFYFYYCPLVLWYPRHCISFLCVSSAIWFFQLHGIGQLCPLFSSSSRIQSHTDWFIYDEWLSSQWLHWK